MSPSLKCQSAKLSTAPIVAGAVKKTASALQFKSEVINS
ncbi:MAG: hypothetical protein OFPI_10840 [Osedax symbiont Rs2]|nr:MAG: hypothetical protein OFPI_10840 [Osedax symbiont Rs2]